MDLADAGELLAYFTVFWCFLLWPAFRRHQLAEFRAAGVVARGIMLVDAVFSVGVGLLPLMYAWWAFAP